MEWMDLALQQAELAAGLGEVPVGAVLVDACTNRLVAKAHNQMRARNNPLAHAEILVLEQAFQQTGQHRLLDHQLYVTLEPCPMCAQAISFARIKTLYFGAYDPKGGGVEHGAHIFEVASCFHKPHYWGGIQEVQCSTLLKTFFKTLRC